MRLEDLLKLDILLLKAETAAGMMDGFKLW